MRSIEVVLKIFFLLLHMLQFVVSMEGGWILSAVVASVLTGAQAFKVETYKNLFRISPWLVGSLGTIVWFIVAVLEASFLE